MPLSQACHSDRIPTALFCREVWSSFFERDSAPSDSDSHEMKSPCYRQPGYEPGGWVILFSFVTYERRLGLLAARAGNTPLVLSLNASEPVPSRRGEVLYKVFSLIPSKLI